LDQARARASRVDLTIFRGTDDEARGSWGFAPEVGEAMAGRLAEHLLGSQMFVYRELMRVGLCLHLHAEFGPKEVVAFRDATDRRIELLERRTEGREPTGTPDADVVDLWILRNLTFYFGLGIDNLVDSILPEKLLLMEKRMARVHEMAIALPLPAALAG
jgi:hypothetical protein